MARSGTSAAVSVERFFQFSLWGLVASGYLAVAGSGYLDWPTLVLTSAGLALRILLVLGVVRLRISDRLVAAVTIAYLGFFPLDFLFVSGGFLEATVHLVFFLAVIKILTAHTPRDYIYMAAIAFLELLAAALLSASLNFFVFLALYLLFAMAAFTSAEIRRSIENPQTVAHGGLRHFHLRLAGLTGLITVGILSLTAGLFFMLPRTAEAAFQRLIARRFYLPGFSNQVTLGEIGEIKNNSRAVMHVRFMAGEGSNLKWRGAALAEFDGRHWYNRSMSPQAIPVESGSVTLARDRGRMAGRPISYRVELNAIDTDVLFFAGTPQAINLAESMLIRTATGGFRLSHIPAPSFHYYVDSVLDDGAPRVLPPEDPLGPEDRRSYLQLPRLDPRISALARRVTAGQATDLNRARAIERHLRTEYGYTLELPTREMPDPLAYFLFERRKGHCEYFASAMTVMLRVVGIPARLVNGFQSGVFNPISELYVLRGSDAHSWVEAWLPERGWTTFDPTPPDANAGTASLWARLALWSDAAETFWQEWVLAYDLGRQATLADRMQQSSRRLGLRWFDHLREAQFLWKARITFALRRYAVALLAALAFLALGVRFGGQLWNLWRMRQGRRRLRRGQASVADATLLYTRMLEVVARRGYEKPAWFTPLEFAGTLPGSELGIAVRRFTAAYNALRFGGRWEAAPQLSLLLDRLERQGR